MPKSQNINSIKSQELKTYLDEFLALNQARQEIQKRYSEISQNLLDKMSKLGYNEIVLNDNYIQLYHIRKVNSVFRKEYDTLDTDLLKTEYAEIYKKCKTKTMPSTTYLKTTKA